jgi:hypothetical protein
VGRRVESQPGSRPVRTACWAGCSPPRRNTRSSGSTESLKGGTCARKCLFETCRFSEDLDYSILPVAPWDAASIAADPRRNTRAAALCRGEPVARRIHSWRKAACRRTVFTALRRKNEQSEFLRMGITSRQIECFTVSKMSGVRVLERTFAPRYHVERGTPGAISHGPWRSIPARRASRERVRAGRSACCPPKRTGGLLASECLHRVDSRRAARR